MASISLSKHSSTDASLKKDSKEMIPLCSYLRQEERLTPYLLANPLLNRKSFMFFDTVSSALFGVLNHIIVVLRCKFTK